MAGFRWLESDLRAVVEELRVFYLVKEREREGVSPLPVSLNLSPADFEHMNVVAELVECCDKAGVSRRLVCIELRESMAITNVQRVQKYLKELRSAGFEVWMDDFGRNLTSLGALRDLEFDLIKMDMELRTARLSSRASPAGIRE